VGQHVADVDLATVEMDGGDQPVFVPADVEHNEVSDFVRRGEGSPQGFKARKVVPLHDFEPSEKGTFTVRVLFPKLALGLEIMCIQQGYLEMR
jgi:hypothetical protein